MTKKVLLFDLDGTISDSGPGITRCAGLALEHFGIPIPNRETMRRFVGPPLRRTFLEFGVPEARVEEAMQVYRRHYLDGGLYECTMYPGIDTLLATLRAHGHTICLATAKPEPMAREVLAYFKLEEMFHFICGATLDSSRDTKAGVIDYLLKQVDCDRPQIMIGDTDNDVIGAAAFDIPTIGVLWGYGTRASMEAAGAKAFAESCEELLTLLEA